MFFNMGGFGGYPQQETQQQPQQSQPANTTLFYQILEVQKDATTQQIRKAFRKKALKEHPDKGGDPQKFKQISQAYQVLNNPQKRQLYDQYGEEGVKNGGPPNQGFGGFGNLFKKDSGPKKTPVKLVEINVTLQEIFTGTTKKITFTKLKTCEDCQGKGGKDPLKCQQCKGHGYVIKLISIGMGFQTQQQFECPKCKKLGVIFTQENLCKKCQGQKVHQVQKNIDVQIQVGCPDMHDYILKGQSDQYPGIETGDVYARVKIVNHQQFIRKGADLFYNKDISLLEALTGVTMHVKHLDGKTHEIATSPVQILSNKVIKTVKKLGLPFYKDSTSFGNLHIQFYVKFPESLSLSSEQLKQLEILNEKDECQTTDIDPQLQLQMEQYFIRIIKQITRWNRKSRKLKPTCTTDLMWKSMILDIKN